MEFKTFKEKQCSFFIFITILPTYLFFIIYFVLHFYFNILFLGWNTDENYHLANCGMLH